MNHMKLIFSILSLVSEEDISREAQEVEMPREKYVHDLQLILTREGETDQSYSFHLAPEQSRSPVLQLSYDKVQSNMSVSGMLWFANIIFPILSWNKSWIRIFKCRWWFAVLLYCLVLAKLQGEYICTIPWTLIVPRIYPNCCAIYLQIISTWYYNTFYHVLCCQNNSIILLFRSYNTMDIWNSNALFTD